MKKGDKDENLWPEDYLDIIRPHLRPMISYNKSLIKLKDPNDTIIEDDLSGNGKFS